MQPSAYLCAITSSLPGLNKSSLEGRVSPSLKHAGKKAKDVVSRPV